MSGEYYSFELMGAGVALFDYDGDARLDVASDGFESGLLLRADRVHVYTRGNGLGGEHTTVDIFTNVGLVQQQDRSRATVPGLRDVALDPPEVEITVEA